MSTIQCNIVSPEGELFSGPVELLSAEGGAGEIAITPRHAPLLTNLKPGPVKLVLEGGEEEIFFASGGFLEVQPGEVTLLTDVAERADDIDSAVALWVEIRLWLGIFRDHFLDDLCLLVRFFIVGYKEVEFSVSSIIFLIIDEVDALSSTKF